jgi:protein required for attachment to host cells
MSTWVLVAHRAGARLFERQGRELRLVQAIENPAGRIQDQDLETGSHRTFDSHAQGRSARDSAASPHQRAALSFARDLAKLLEDARLSGAATSIVLVAEPHFLGLLRGELSAASLRLVAATVPKDLYAEGAHQLTKRIADVLPTSLL